MVTDTAPAVRTRTITLPPLHPAQHAVATCPARFVVAACGRRFGKGVAAATVQLRTGLSGGQAWHVAPDYPAAQEHWRLLKFLARQLGDLADIRQADMMIAFKHGGFIQIKSANSLLRGSGLDHLTIDECGHIAELRDIWTLALRPTLSDRRGRALFISSPNGLDYFHDLYGYGLDPALPEWGSFTFPTSANPHIPADEIETARQSLPDRVFRQEYLAEFLTDGAGVFRFVRDVSICEVQAAPMEGHRYSFGIDFGRTHDFTRISVIDMTTRRQVALDGFTGISWEMTRSRIRTMFERWRPVVIFCEGNSFGSPNIEQLANDGLPVREFTTTAQSKAEIIDALALAIEKGAANEDGGVLLLDDGVQKAELLAYTFERLPSGSYRYSAPSGKHDDTVIALALAWYGVPQVSSISFISADLWDARQTETTCPPELPIVVGLAASMDSKAFAAIGVSRQDDQVFVRLVRIWRSEGSTPMDMSAIEAALCEFAAQHYVIQFAYSESELTDLAVRLRKQSVGWFRPFPPSDRVVADKLLLDNIAAGRITHDGDPVLREHMLSAERNGGDNVLRITQRAPHLPIAGAAALVMANFECRRLNL